MTVLPFRRHGVRRVAQIEAALQQRLDHWRAQWAAEPGHCEVQVAEVALPPSPGQWWHCTGNSAFAHLGNNGLERIAAALAAVPGRESSPIAAGIGRRAFADLLRELVPSAAEVIAGPAPMAALCDARHGVLCFSVSLPGAEALLYLPLAACDALVPIPAGVSRPVLASRRSALLASTVSLYATLELGTADLDVASTLRPGETLRTSRIADAVVKLQSVDGHTVFSASLHSSEGRKALRCINDKTQSGMK